MVIIGITCKSDTKSFYLPRPYVMAVTAAGGTPLVLPHVDGTCIDELSNLLDGLLLAGGGDIHPMFYGGTDSDKLKRVDPTRDRFELTLVKRFARTGKPILGICRGMQVLNVAFGGNLYHDVGELTDVNHWQKAPEHEPIHTIRLKKGTLLHKIMGQTTLMVNSFHHQAVKTVADGFIVSALAEDGIIEAIEHPDYGFMLGVQFHPEYMYESEPFNKLFAAFVAACKR